MQTAKPSPAPIPPIINTTRMDDPRLAAVAEAARRQQIADEVGRFSCANNPEMAKQVVGNILHGQEQEVMSDDAFDRFMTGVHVHIDETKSKWMNEVGGAVEAVFEHTIDFEPELDDLKAHSDAGTFKQKTWSKFGNGQGIHGFRMSNVALQMFMNRYDFHPCSDWQEFSRIAHSDPWVMSFVTNRNAL